MRFKSVFTTLLVFAAPFPGALAQTSDTAAVTRSVPADISPAARLDALFDELKHQGDQEKAKAISENIRLTLRDEAFGQRHFILADPGGVLVDVIKPIPPSAEFANLLNELGGVILLAMMLSMISATVLPLTGARRQSIA